MDALTGESMLWEVGHTSSYFLLVKISYPMMLAWMRQHSTSTPLHWSDVRIFVPDAQQEALAISQVTDTTTLHKWEHAQSLGTRQFCTVIHTYMYIHNTHTYSHTNTLKVHAPTVCAKEGGPKRHTLCQRTQVNNKKITLA